MNSIHAKCVLAAAAAALAGAAQAQPMDTVAVDPYQSIYVRTDGLPQAVARRVEEEAQKGLRPLRQYGQRTKYIHQLDLIPPLMTREQAQVAMPRDATGNGVLIARQ